MAHLKSQSKGNLETLGALFIRYGLVLVLLWIGVLKLTAFEAEGVFNHASHSPLLAWGYHLVDVRTFSVILGLFGWIFAILIAIRPISPKLSVIGSVGAIRMFLSP
jgi:reactive chlorine resistance protein C